MDLTGIIGIFTGFGMLILGFVLEHGKVSSLLLLSPAVIVFGGTFGALLLSFSKYEIAKIPKLFIEALKPQKFQPQALIEYIVEIADVVRKKGLLSVEEMLENDKTVDPLLKKGMLMCIDGFDSQKITNAMQNEIYIVEQRKNLEASIFEAAGGYSPTMGIMGTVLGLVNVLSNMGSPEELAANIAVAFIATLYGVAFANLLYLPIASRLKTHIKYYRVEKELIIDGVLTIQSGVNPKIVRETLSSYLEFSSAGKGKKAKGAIDEKE